METYRTNGALSQLLRAALAFMAVGFLTVPALAQVKTYIYGETNAGNTANNNAVFAYSNDGSGNMVALAGQPYLTNGTGILDLAGGGTEFDADQEVITNTAGTLLYAVNGHSNTISGFTINADGTLTAIPGTPIDSGGHDPASLGLSGNFLVVANKNEDPNQDNTMTVPNFTTFTVNADGSLTLNANSTFNLADGSSPSQALTVPGTHSFFGMNFLIPQIVDYAIKGDGSLAVRASIGPPTEGDLFLGEALHPTKKNIYVGLPATSQVGVYKYSSQGITFLRTVPNNGAAICWLTVNSTGTRLYTAETESATITVYDITAAGMPIQLQQLQLTQGASTVSNIVLDPTGAYLYALSTRTIHICPVDANGLLTDTLPVVTLQAPGTAHPLGLVVVRK